MSDLLTMLQSLAGLVKVDAAIVKTGDITGIKANEVAAFKTGDISIASRLREIQICAVDRSNRIENLTMNFVPITNQSYQINLILNTPDDLGRIFNLPTDTATLRPDSKDSVHRIALKTGSHIIVNDPAWFANKRSFSANSQSTLVPVSSGDQESIIDDALEANRKLVVHFKNGLPSRIDINWGEINHTAITIGKPAILGHSEWVFHPLEINQPLYLDSACHNVMSVDAAIVERIWRLERTHRPISHHSARPMQQFFFLIKKPSMPVQK